MITAAVAAFTITTSTASAVETPALDAVHRNVRLTQAEQRRDYRPVSRYFWGPDRAVCDAGCRWHSAVKWYARYRHAVIQPRLIIGPQAAIGAVFGAYTGQALTVAWCESRWSTTAVNGQYEGLFQMGSWERATYAHGRYATALDQSWAAYRYFVASGSDWSPWECQP